MKKNCIDNLNFWLIIQTILQDKLVTSKQSHWLRMNDAKVITKVYSKSFNHN